jgi:selenocysteine lyase/cysteine desulfurase
MVVRLSDGRTTTIDFRERAPAASSPGMFLDSTGAYSSRVHHNTHVAVGVPGIRAIVEERTARLIDIADAAGVEVVSPREDSERAGIVVLEPPPEFVSALAAALHNHGVSVTVRAGRVRLGAHVSTGDDTLELFRQSLAEFSTQIRA